MAAAMLGAVAGVTVRETLRNRNESYWLRQYALDPPAGQMLVVDSLFAVRPHLDQHLRMQLSFFVRVKFAMQVVRPEDPFRDREDADIDHVGSDHYLVQPAPWHSGPNPDPDRDQRMADIVEAARLKLEEHMESARLRNSRELIGGILHMYLLVGPGTAMNQLPPAPTVGEDRPMGGPHPHPLPEELAKKKCIWNPCTEDHSCFQWCVRAHLAEWRKLPDRRPELSNRLVDEVFFEPDHAPVRGRYSKKQKRVLRTFGYDWSTLPDPAERGVTWADIDSFEQANAGKIHIFVYDWCEIQWHGTRYFERHLVREPKFEKPAAPEHEIHLLRLGNHYVLIHNLDAFYSSRGAAMDGSRSLTNHIHMCPRCRCNFKTVQSLAKHRRHPCSYDPSGRKPVLKMPNKRKSVVRYKPGNSNEFMALTMYGDLETITETAPTETIAVDIPCVQKRVASAAFRAVGRNGFVVPPEELVYLTRTELEDGEHDAMERCLRKMLRLARRYDYWRKTVNVPANPTEEQLREHRARTHCQECQVKFVQGDKNKGKVMHHRHGAGDYIASICFQCNRRIRQPRQVPVFFHNGGGYDFKFLLRAIAHLQNEPEPEEDDEDEGEDEGKDEGKDKDKEESEDESEDEHGDVPQVSLEEYLSEEVDFKKLSFRVLFKSGEKLLPRQLGLQRLRELLQHQPGEAHGQPGQDLPERRLGRVPLHRRDAP